MALQFPRGAHRNGMCSAITLRCLQVVISRQRLSTQQQSLTFRLVRRVMYSGDDADKAGWNDIVFLVLTESWGGVALRRNILELIDTLWRHCRLLNGIEDVAARPTKKKYVVVHGAYKYLPTVLNDKRVTRTYDVWSKLNLCRRPRQRRLD